MCEGRSVSRFQQPISARSHDQNMVNLNLVIPEMPLLNALLRDV